MEVTLFCLVCIREEVSDKRVLKFDRKAVKLLAKQAEVGGGKKNNNRK